MSRIFRRVSQMFDFQDDVAEGEFLTKQGGLLVGAAGGGGGLTFAQILAALAAIGVTIDETTGATTFSPTGDVSSFHAIPPPVGNFAGYVPFRIEKPGGSAGFNEDFLDIEYDGLFVIVPPGESDDFYFNLQGNLRRTRFYTGKITDGTLSYGVVRWGAESGVDDHRLGFFNVTPVEQPAAPTTLNELVDAVQTLGLTA